MTWLDLMALYGSFYPHTVFSIHSASWRANLPSVINANVSGRKKTVLANRLLKGRWAQKDTLFTPDISGIQLAKENGGEREKKKNLSMFMWKPSCGNLPAVWSHCNWRTWQWIFLNPQKTSRPVLRGGQTRRDGDVPSERPSANPCAPYRGRVPNLLHLRTRLLEIRSFPCFRVCRFTFPRRYDGG